jgi:hypothetical protein
MSVAFLLVTCCLEESRARLLDQVIANLRTEAPELATRLTVFDNASTVLGTRELLTSNFTNVWQADRNVGYWSAIDWWLWSCQHRHDPPKYTYIIESDMIHYDFNRLWTCAKYLDDNPDVGSIRLHEYSIAERHLYDKDRPQPQSRRGLWQTHHNRVTGKPVKIDHSSGDIWSTTFLTQLPALNRYETMLEVFKQLGQLKHFTELDFQSRYWDRYQRTGILDGGLFHCNLNPYGARGITGSWTSEADLHKLGYQATRQAFIVPRDQYNVSRLG